MSRADLLYRETCARILREGVWDTDQSVRPRWADGSRPIRSSASVW